MTSSPYSAPAVKKSAWHFLVGKALTATLTFTILLAVVRLLPIVEYGVYVTVVAGVEFAIALVTSGLSWIAHRYIPEFRLCASGVQTRRFIHRLLGLTTGILIVIALVLFLGLDGWLGWTRLNSFGGIVRIALLWLVVEGTWRFIRDAVLGPLLLQGLAQIGMVLRSGAMLVFLIGRAWSGSLALPELLWAEVLVSAGAMVVVLWGLWPKLKSLPTGPGAAAWNEPGIPAMARTGRHMFAASLLALLYSPQAFLLIVQRLLGTEMAAIFGFLRSLYDQISRYLPATLLFAVIRPKLVASYVAGQAAREVNTNANIAGKLSLFVLMPLVAFAVVAGQDVVSLLSGLKFASTGYLFAGLTLALIPLSQQQLLETLAVVTGNSVLCVRAAIIGLLMPGILYGLLHLGIGLWAPVVALALGNFLYNGAIVAGLVGRVDYRGDPAGFGKLLVAAVAACAGAALVPVTTIVALDVVLEGIVTIAVFLLAAWVIKPFGELERTRMNRLFPWRWFVW